MGSRADRLRARIGRFRILVLGRANAGKTTILQKVCTSIEEPEIFDAKGVKIDPSVITPSTTRGVHDIDRQLVFKSNPGFIFHDSHGFEAGGKNELDIVRNFITQRGKRRTISKRLHVIWYCIPLSDSRPITAAEENFFKHGTGDVPVVVIFTKLDALERQLWSEEESSFERARRVSLFRAKTYFERLREMEYPPHGGVYFRDLHLLTTQVGELIEATTDSLTDNNLQRILVSIQRINLEICVKYALRDSMHLSRALSRAPAADKQARIIFRQTLTYFPHINV